ncbi:MAG: hypothetical protein BGP12_16970 [Rhodospirillales bacterium 70-18]|nr:MAG: hypothetical protein BGP12_16970 [Rhodospirillales bacterium 70-18]
MVLFVEQAINGCALGALYALSGLALWLVFAATGVVNVAQAGVSLLAALAGLACLSVLGWPLALPAAALAAVLAGAAVAVLVELLVFLPLRDRVAGQSGGEGGGEGGVVSQRGLVVAVAAWFVLDRLAGLAIGGQPRPVPPDAGPAFLLRLAGLHVPGLALLTLALLAAAAGGLSWMDQRTRFAVALRAVGADPVAAALGGVDVRLVLLGVAALAGAASGLAGLLGGLAAGEVSAGLGQGQGLGLMLKGLVAALVGGRFGLAGVVAAGLALGLAEIASGGWFAFALRDGAGYAVLLAVLLAPHLLSPRPLSSRPLSPRLPVPDAAGRG